MGLIIGGVSAHDLILDGQSVSLYAGGSPPVKVWPTREKVQITLGTGTQARDQLRAELTARGLDYQTVTEIPFDIDLVGTGSAKNMFLSCWALTTVPAMDTSQVTEMGSMFRYCYALTHVPAMDTSSVTDMSAMFSNCEALTYVPAMNTSQVTGMGSMFYGCSTLTSVPAMDVSSVMYMGSMFYECTSLTYVPDMNTSQVTGMDWMFGECTALTQAPAMDTSSATDTAGMFWNCSSLTSVPDMDTAKVTGMWNMFDGCAALTDGNVRLIGRHPSVNTSMMIDNSGLTREPWYTADGKPIDVHKVTLTNVDGMGTVHPLVSVTVPAGQVWNVQIEGTVTATSSITNNQPVFRIGSYTSAKFGPGASVDLSGTVSSSNATIAMVTNAFSDSSFTGTVTIRKQ